METWHAYYSEQADQIYGTCFWLNSNNKEVEITAVYKSKEEAEANYLWDDKVYLGEVVKYSRKGQKGKYAMRKMQNN